MRRRPIILCFLAAAVLGGAPGALADPPGTTVAVKALGEAPDAQFGPTVAVNPVAGASAAAVALGTDWRAGLFQPQTGEASGVIQGTTGATTWSDNGLLPSSTSSPPAVSGGSPDVVWGPGNAVYAVELGRDSTDPANPCSSTAGLYLSISSNGGTSWAPPIELVPNNANQTVADPSIAYSAVTGRIYVAYTVSEPCNSGSPATEVRLVSITPALSNRSQQGVSPGGAVLAFEHPSIAALPNGSVAVAYYDGSSSPGRVLVTTCAPTDPADVTSAPLCTATPTVVDGSATDPTSIGPLAVDVRPAIVADPTANRLVVAWNESTGISSSDVFSATSLDGGATFGPSEQVNAGQGYQFDPALAMAPDGRVDLAYFDSEFSPGTGYEIAVSASNRPSAGYSEETWSASRSLESSRIVPTSPNTPGAPDLGSRIGLAEIPRTAPGSRAWTLVAWPDTDNVTGSSPHNVDIYSSVLLHQATTPVATPFSSPQTVSKNAPNTLTFASQVTDPDADPLTYSIISPGSLGTATIPDPNVPTLVYTGTQAVGGDSVKVGITDGVHTTTLLIALSVQNDPPTISCTSLETPYETPILIASTNCGYDKNGDPVTLSALNPVNGTLTGSGSTLAFVPPPRFSGTAQIMLIGNDGQLSSVATPVLITVDPPKAVAVGIVPSGVRSARTDQPIVFHATSLDPDTDTTNVIWSFSDGTSSDRGESISHLFQKPGTYSVWAQVGDGPRAQVQVYVQKPPLVVRATSLLHHKTVKLQLQIASTGRLVVKLPGLAGHHTLSARMTRGLHTVRMLLPVSARRRGTIMVTLALTLPNGGTEHLRRAVMLVRD